MRQNGSRSQRGQVMTEFVVMVVFCSIVAGAALWLLLHFTRFGWWILRLIGIGYP